MSNLIIKYRNFGNEISERCISDIHNESEEAIDAFCHLKNERRTFKVENIYEAINSDTGELIENLWKFFGLDTATDGREKLVSITAPYLAAIKALKFFSLKIRGFSFRERNYLVSFIQSRTHCNEYSSEEIHEWLQKLWCGDVHAYKNGDTKEYFGLLHSINPVIKDECKNVALCIARGSGRKPISQEIIERIASEFGSDFNK